MKIDGELREVLRADEVTNQRALDADMLRALSVALEAVATNGSKTTQDAIDSAIHALVTRITVQNVTFQMEVKP
jgi:hypothetical protein